MSVATSHRQHVQATGPCDSLRDYMAALEAGSRLLRSKEMNQDRYEATAFAYRLIDELGCYAAPAILIERVKIDGRRVDGPVIANLYGALDTQAIAHGVEEITDNQQQMYRAGMDKIAHLAGDNAEWGRSKPVVVDNAVAPCKEVVVTGESIDKKFPGEGITAGQHVAANKLTAKTIIVVDDHINVLSPAVGSRWQPHPASLVIPQTTGMPTSIDLSTPHSGITSKIVIDATRQMPQEGGPASWAPISCIVLEENCPEAFEPLNSKGADCLPP